MNTPDSRLADRIIGGAFERLLRMLELPIESVGDILNRPEFPLRAGELIDSIICKQHVGRTIKVIESASFIINCETWEFYDKARNQSVRLTEKEGKIIAYLVNSPGRVVERTELLRAVWEYVDGIDTHTLETHIYRLRRKIEQDPENPCLLIRQENGYRLNP